MNIFDYCQHGIYKEITCPRCNLDNRELQADLLRFAESSRFREDFKREIVDKKESDER